MNILICPCPILRRLIRDLAVGRRTVLLRVGTRSAPGGHAWLVRDIVPATQPDRAPSRAASTWIVQSTDDPSPVPAGLFRGESGRLDIGANRWRGRVWGLVQTPNGVEPLDQVLAPGPGMHRIYTFNRRRIEHSIDQGTEPDVPVHQRWSRTIGALGGLDVWRRLTELRVGIVGCGRSGSVAAAMLARLGIRRLVLIDPDKIEPHNLGEMDLVSAGDLGRAKAQAVASGLKRMLTGDEADVATIVASLTHSGSLQAARDCDVLFCCADDDAARLACALIATLDHKVLLDVGTGVRFENPERIAPSPSRVMGADVRLIVPGDGCLLCRGGLTRLARALDDLCYPIRPRPPSPDDEDWRRERAGSLTSLNHMAVAMGIQMLQDLVAERIRSSTWAQLEFDRGGRMAVGYPEAARAAGEMSCSLCAKAGLGDEGLRPER